MKVQTLNENLIKALNGIKENQVNICNVVVNRKPLLEALKINKKFDLITLESGKTTWVHDSGNTHLKDANCLRICLDHTVMTLLNQEVNYKNPNPAKLDFTCGQSKQGTPLNTQEFIKALEFVLMSIATEQSRPALTCVDFKIDNGILKLAGADGFRLAISQMAIQGLQPCEFLLEGIELHKKLLPFVKTVKPLTKVCKNSPKEYPDINIEILEKSVKFYTDKGVIELQKFEANFPEYEKLMPTWEHTTLEFISNTP